MKKDENVIEYIDTHAHCHLLRAYHPIGEDGNELIDDERVRFLLAFQNQKGHEKVIKVINIPINYTQNIDWPNNDLRSVFFSERPNGIGVFRERLQDEDGNMIKGLNYFAQGLHPKFVHQLLYKEFLYVNGESRRKAPSTIKDLVDEKELRKREAFIKRGIEIQLRNHKDIVAVGETGLEYYYDFEKRICDHPAYQEKWFRYHLDLAYEYDLPLIIHLRSGKKREQNANKKAISILKEYKSEGKLRLIPGVIHCFIGNKSEALEFHRLGFMLGIGAAFSYGDPVVVPFLERPSFQNKKFRKLYQVVCDIPLDWIVLETDAPYIPVKCVSEFKENTPLSIPVIAKMIVNAKNKSLNETDKNYNANKKRPSVTLEQVAQITTNNAYCVFPGLLKER